MPFDPREHTYSASQMDPDYLKSAHPTTHRRIEMQYPDRMFNSRPTITSVAGKRG